MNRTCWEYALSHLKEYKPNVGAERSTILCIVDQYLKAIGVPSELIEKVIEADVIAEKEGLFKECTLREAV